MRKLRTLSLAAAVALGLATGSARAGEEDSGRSSAWAPTWQWKPFGGPAVVKDEPKPVEKKPAPKPEPPPAKKPPAKPTVVETASAERARQEAALLRRLQVCDKLKEVALRNQDKQLLRQAEELEERAQATYTQRTARLLSTENGKASEDRKSDPLHGAEAAGYTVSSKDKSSRASKEANP